MLLATSAGPPVLSSLYSSIISSLPLYPSADEGCAEAADDEEAEDEEEEEAEDDDEEEDARLARSASVRWVRCANVSPTFCTRLMKRF